MNIPNTVRTQDSFHLLERYAEALRNDQIGKLSKTLPDVLSEELMALLKLAEAINAQSKYDAACRATEDPDVLGVLVGVRAFPDIEKKILDEYFTAEQRRKWKVYQEFSNMFEDAIRHTSATSAALATARDLRNKEILAEFERARAHGKTTEISPHPENIEKILSPAWFDKKKYMLASDRLSSGLFHLVERPIR